MNATTEVIDELRRVMAERDEARADLARSVSAWESAGMQGLTAHDAMLALAKERDEAFRRGAEAMREACAQWVDHWVSGHVADKLRDMPTPEEPRP